MYHFMEASFGYEAIKGLFLEGPWGPHGSLKGPRAPGVTRPPGLYLTMFCMMIWRWDINVLLFVMAK